MALWGSKAPLASRALPVPLDLRVIPDLSVLSDPMALKDPVVLSALLVLQVLLVRWGLLVVPRTERRDLPVLLVPRDRWGLRETSGLRDLRVQLVLTVNRV
jgi:hypothetical protein